MDNLCEALEALNHKYFGLAYILLPEELMATQLLIDGSSRMLVALRVNAQGELPQEEELEVLFVKNLIELARIRQKHFAYKKSESFFKLSFDERVVLYLRDKKHYGPSFIGQVLSCREEVVLGLSHKARASLLAYEGVDLNRVGHRMRNQNP